ncbi:restriction endonuclease [Chachezhania sediminis]|uniref:restriction endonuclease n=1 Tax=Chachezhania sediminis TaxID=2599291 RepID=UPI0018EF0072|nr:restriction endonuclease [Chachezhania sediminis]
MIPDFQTLMRPVLAASAAGERRIGEVVDEMATAFRLTDDERHEMLDSGRQTRIANRVHWARAYLKQAGLVRATRRGYYEITDRGREALASGPERITMQFLDQFPEYREFQTRSNKPGSDVPADNFLVPHEAEKAGGTPDEVLNAAHAELQDALASELLSRIRESSPDFFESAVVRLLLRMGYGGEGGSGEVLGRSGDGGVDGVIDKDPLGIDQVYVQAKRYGASSTVGAGEIRDFFGALSLKDVSRGIFVTSGTFSSGARTTAEKLGARIVLIDGTRLVRLMIAHSVGCRVTRTLEIAEVDEEFFQ